MADRDVRRAADSLLQSDRDYFAAGADEVPFAGGRLFWMPGLEQVAAGCVAMPDQAVHDPEHFVAEAAGCASATGAPLLRFYTPGEDDFPAFATAGLQPSVELGFVAPTAARFPKGAPAARIRPVRHGDDWGRKLRLAAALEQLPDGKQAAAADWTKLERRKCDAGYMNAFLIELDGERCGAFSLAKRGSLLRLKNLVVHPHFRRRGVACAAVGFALDQAREAGLDWVGAFALAEGAGRALYEQCGFAVVARQSEWSGPIAAVASVRPAERRTA